jgi:hypothetical protein
MLTCVTRELGASETFLTGRHIMEIRGDGVTSPSHEGLKK